MFSVIELISITYLSCQNFSFSAHIPQAVPKQIPVRHLETNKFLQLFTVMNDKYHNKI